MCVLVHWKDSSKGPSRSDSSFTRMTCVCVFACVSVSICVCAHVCAGPLEGLLKRVKQVGQQPHADDLCVYVCVFVCVCVFACVCACVCV